MATRLQECCWKFCYIPQRVILALMGTLAVVTIYTSRVCLNLAITQMVVPLNKTVSSDDTCPREEGQEATSTKDESELYVWSESEQGLILGSFYVGYIVSHVPGGILADMYGGKHVMGSGILTTVILGLLTPVFIKLTDGNWIMVFFVRLGQGLGQGMVYPALTTLLAKWIPKSERALVGSIVFSASNIGTILSNMISGNLMAATGTWTSVFYLWGVQGLLWCIAWYLLCFSTPQNNPYIKPKEMEFLESQIGPKKEKKKIPWVNIMKSAPNWALIMGQIGHAWGKFTVATDLPKYYNDVLKFNIKKNALWTSVPYALMIAISISNGYVVDLLINKKKIEVTCARKTVTTIASAGPAIFLVIAGYVGCDQTAASWIFSVGTSLMGFYYSGLKVNAMDLSPNYAGTLMALNNGLGGITGFTAPAIIGFITTDHTLSEWRVVFWITFAVFMFTNIIYLIWASGNVQWWNDSDTPPPKPPKGGETSTETT